MKDNPTLQISNLKTPQACKHTRVHTCPHAQNLFFCSEKAPADLRKSSITNSQGRASAGWAQVRKNPRHRGQGGQVFKSTPLYGPGQSPRARGTLCTMGRAACWAERANRSQMWQLQERGPSLCIWENLKEFWKSHKS